MLPIEAVTTVVQSLLIALPEYHAVNWFDSLSNFGLESCRNFRLKWVKRSNCPYTTQSGVSEIMRHFT